MKLENYMKHTKCKNELDLVNHVRSLLPDYDHWEIKVRAHVYSALDWHWKPIIEDYKTVAKIQKEIKSDFNCFSTEDAALTILSDYEYPFAPKAFGNIINSHPHGFRPLAHYLQYVDLNEVDDSDPVKQVIIEERKLETIKDIIE